jgi:ADP-ribosyl-[dinitrogen reductase] hydrolase
MAVNLGDDADTIGAVYGQLAGAFYGETGIPTRWLSKLAHNEKIIEMADDIYRLSRTVAKSS